MKKSVNGVATSLTDTTSTMHERLSLEGGINLSDGHSRLLLTNNQQAIVDRFPQLFRQSTTAKSHTELEMTLLHEFYTLGGQSIPFKPAQYMLSYSASCIITMLASYFLRTSKRVALIEPIFDNIPSILVREGVSLTSVAEESLHPDVIQKTLESITEEVLWLCSPNNPTGNYIDQATFQLIAEHCASKNKILVIDFCFRLFCENMAQWDQYKILKDSGVSFIMIEDTGKTWSTAEMKVGILVCSEDLFPHMYRLQDDLLQSVSPFHLKLITEYIKDARKNGKEDSFLSIIQKNRSLLRECFADSLFDLPYPHSSITVEWLGIGNTFSGEELTLALSKLGVHILPGTNFYWKNPLKGKQFIRIALSRPTSFIQEGAPIIKRVAEQLAQENELLVIR